MPSFRVRTTRPGEKPFTWGLRFFSRERAEQKIAYMQDHPRRNMEGATYEVVEDDRPPNVVDRVWESEMAEDQQCAICASYLIGVGRSYTPEGGYRCVRHNAVFDPLRNIVTMLRANRKAAKDNEDLMTQLRDRNRDLNRAYNDEAHRLASIGAIPSLDYDTLEEIDGGG